MLNDVDLGSGSLKNNKKSTDKITYNYAFTFGNQYPGGPRSGFVCSFLDDYTLPLKTKLCQTQGWGIATILMNCDGLVGLDIATDNKIDHD